MRYLAMIALMIGCYALIDQPVSAAPEDYCNQFKPSPMNTYRVNVVNVTDIIPARERAQTGVFLQKTVTVSYQEGQIVWMEGWLPQGAFWVIDTIRIEASPSGKVWERTFERNSRNRLQISEGPQEITHFLVPGDNSLTVTLENRYSNEYGAIPLHFSVWEPCTPPTRTPTPTIWITPTPWLRPSATPTLQPSATATEAAGAAAAVIPTRTPQQAVQPLPMISTELSTGPANSRSLWFGLALAGGCLWWVRRHYRSA